MSDTPAAATDAQVMRGWGTVTLFGPDGEVKHVEEFTNLITTAGDQYYAKMGAALVGVPNAAQPTKVTGMKLGTATTTPAKSGGGAALGTYITASNVVFDSTYPQTSAKAGTDTGWYVSYQTTWAAGVATNATINEVVIVNDQSSNATSTAANSISRATISTVNKAAGDTLQILWNHLTLGA